MYLAPEFECAGNFNHRCLLRITHCNTAYAEKATLGGCLGDTLTDLA